MNFEDKLDIILEARIKEIAPDIVAKKFANELANYGITRDDISMTVLDDSIQGEISADYDFTDHDRNNLNDYLSKRGWMLSKLYKWRHPRMVDQEEKWYFLLASNYGKQIDVGKLYHVTRISNVAKILQNGLVPKGGHKHEHWSGFYPPRVYLHTASSDAVRMATNFRERFKEKMAVLEIRLPKNIKIYVDPEDPIDKLMAWTYSHIKPQNITQLVVIDKNTDEIYQSRNPIAAAKAFETK